MEFVNAPSRVVTFHSLGFNFSARQLSPVTRWNPPVSIPSHPPCRIRIGLPKWVCLRKAKSDDSTELASRGPATVPSTSPAAEGEEARAVLSEFLREQGMSEAAAAGIANRADRFVDHLASKLRRSRESPYLAGRELTTPEMRDVLVPYMESLLGEYGDVLVDVLEKFPNHPGKERAVVEAGLGLKKDEAIAGAGEPGLGGCLSRNVPYLIDIGLDLDQIKEMAQRWPPFAKYTLEGNIEPMVEFLLDLGVVRTDIPVIMYKWPKLCGARIDETSRPTVGYLEDLGVEKVQWPKMISRYPKLLNQRKEGVKATINCLSELGISAKDILKVLTRYPAIVQYSAENIRATVGYLLELGVSAGDIGKVLKKVPNIVKYSVDGKLRPIEEYFCSLGVDVATLACQSPGIFALSLEANIKPTTQYLLDKGFTVEEIRAMVSRHGGLYKISLANNLKLKWEFFMTMDYPKSELLKYPVFFACSLEKRIKPRYNRARKCGVRLQLHQLVCKSDIEFERILAGKTGNWY